jgi:hypothetical protein
MPQAIANDVLTAAPDNTRVIVLSFGTQFQIERACRLLNWPVLDHGRPARRVSCLESPGFFRCWSLASQDARKLRARLARVAAAVRLLDCGLPLQDSQTARAAFR